MVLLLAIAICRCPPSNDGNELRKVSDDSQGFVRSDEIIVVFTKDSTIVGRLKTKVVEILTKGDLKVYGDKVTKVGHNTWKYTLSGTVRRADIEAGGMVRVDDLTRLSITNKKLTINRRHRARETHPRLPRCAGRFGMNTLDGAPSD